jgi:hypothetical protein
VGHNDRIRFLRIQRPARAVADPPIRQSRITSPLVSFQSPSTANCWERCAGGVWLRAVPATAISISATNGRTVFLFACRESYSIFKWKVAHEIFLRALSTHLSLDLIQKCWGGESGVV